MPGCMMRASEQADCEHVLCAEQVGSMQFEHKAMPRYVLD